MMPTVDFSFISDDIHCQLDLAKRAIEEVQRLEADTSPLAQDQKEKWLRLADDLTRNATGLRNAAAPTIALIRQAKR